ncbi:MAG: DOMON-like domain-containing protein [Alphaproteobacteria bacterium]|nr:DOMON-like domain-containing protein [Alphaproteobacteria bacterium]
MRLALIPHGNSLRPPGLHIRVGLERQTPTALVLRYEVSGAVDVILVQAITQTAQADNLWKHTCFEVFVAPSTGEAYFEFNLSPSSQWAAYRFQGYRTGMSVIHEIRAPLITLSQDGQLVLSASLDLGSLLEFAAEPSWRVGVSAVIEDSDGNLSYWALTHPQAKPDFHHPDSFVIHLAAPEPA